VTSEPSESREHSPLAETVTPIPSGVTVTVTKKKRSKTQKKLYRSQSYIKASRPQHRSMLKMVKAKKILIRMLSLRYQKW
jgi:hypothetical protein